VIFQDFWPRILPCSVAAGAARAIVIADSYRSQKATRGLLGSRPSGRGRFHSESTIAIGHCF
jgi:hypothetical protein